MTALVTGASKGIGAAVCEALAAEGCDLVVTGRSIDELSAFAADLGRRREIQVHALAADLSEPAAPHDLAERAWAAAGRIDVLVNNAGVSITGPAREMTRADWDTVMTVNLHAPAMLAADVGGRMADAGGGSIVTIASTAGLRPLTDHFAYSSSKAGLVMATKVLALELGPRGVRANSICPTVVLTEMGTRVWGEEAKAGPMLARIPAGRFVQPEEVARVAVFLASPGSEMVNGTDIEVDGGLLLS